MRHLSESARSTVVAGEVEAALAAALDAGRTAWPGIDVPSARFVQHVAERIPTQTASDDLANAIASMRAADLYLACACATGTQGAIAAFEERYFGGVAAAVPRHADRATLAEEVKQALREQLYVGRDGKPPRIAEYSGRGDLGGWLRVAAARTGLNLLRSETRRKRAHEGARAVPLPAAEPELAIIAAKYGDDFRAALREAANDLTTRERNLLRQHYVDGLTMVELAKLYGLHRVTVVRAIGAAREKLSEGTRARLREKLDVAVEELDSIVRVVGDKVDASIQWLFAPPSKG